MTAAARSGFRLDAAGFAIAALAHAVLLYILTRPHEEGVPPEPAPMEVSFVEEVGPVSSAPASAAQPAPMLGEQMPPDAVSGADASTPAPLTPPVPDPVRPPVQTSERGRPDLTQNRVPVRPATPPRVTPPRPSRTPPSRPQPQPSETRRTFDEIARSIGGTPTPRPGPPAPAAATVTAQAQASFTAALGRQIARCSRQQRPPTLEARSLRPVVVIRLRQDGSLDGAPVVRSVEGINATNRQYETQAREAIVRAVRSCAPYTGLPPELYGVPNGWRQPPPIRLNFQ